MKRIKLMILFGAIFFVSTGFNTDNAIVPQREILSGGPPEDGIPAILAPKFVEAGDAAFVGPNDQVMGMVIDGKAKAYPINILTWHEVVNDTLDETPIVVTY
jgi:hypothetical protein